MQSKRSVVNGASRNVLNNEEGFILIATLVLLATREILRQANANQTTGADPTLFNSELFHYAAGGIAVTSGTIGSYSYTVMLSNDSGDAGGTGADSNNKVMLTSTATGANNTKAIVEIAVSLPPPPTS